MIEKFLSKDTLYLAIVIFIMIVQSNYFATKLDLANLKLEIAQMQESLKDHSDNGDKEILRGIENKLQTLSDKIDRLK